MFLLRRCFGACPLKVRFRIICILTLEGEKGIGRKTRAGGCKRKEQAIETKMEYARKHGNQEQLRGLEEALSQVRQWCSDGTLRSKAELNILEKQDKVKERQADLDKAVTEGKGEKKIAKLQRKLGEAKEELAQAVAKRDALAQ